MGRHRAVESQGASAGCGCKGCGTCVYRAPRYAPDILPSQLIGVPKRTHSDANHARLKDKDGQLLLGGMDLK